MSGGGGHRRAFRGSARDERGSPAAPLRRAQAAPTLGCLLLAARPPGTLGAAIAAILIGLAAGAEFDLLAYRLAAYFGLRRYGAIHGAASAVFGFAAGAAPFAFAGAFDASGSYRAVLIAAAGVFALGGAGLLGLGRCPRPALPQAIMSVTVLRHV